MQTKLPSALPPTVQGMVLPLTCRSNEASGDSSSAAAMTVFTPATT
ncbi:MAG: hypothetical protein R2873_19810 [Caldilineaceae bacterium]